MSDMTMNDYKRDAKEKGLQAAKDLSDALNTMAFGKEVIKGFVEGMTNQHRTLQQSSMKALFAVIEEFAKMGDSGYYDARNQDTVKFCQKVVRENKDTHFAFI